MRVLVACEFSGVVRDAFLARGHDAWSCDLLPTEVDGPHIQGDVFKAIAACSWDLMVAHPPCTYLARSGDRWYRDSALRLKAAIFVLLLWSAPIPRIAIENPRGALNRLWRRPDQTIQPWWFGHGETKTTCLWLKGLPPLMATVVSDGRAPRIHYAHPRPERWRERSRTLPGIAAAMADQWGDLALEAVA
jgi:hypothetical protein